MKIQLPEGMLKKLTIKKSGSKLVQLVTPLRLIWIKRNPKASIQKSKKSNGTGNPPRMHSNSRIWLNRVNSFPTRSLKSSKPK